MTLSEDEAESLAHFLESEEDEKPSKRLRVEQNGVRVKYPRRIDDGFFSLIILIPPELFPHILKFLSTEVKETSLACHAEGWKEIFRKKGK